MVKKYSAGGVVIHKNQVLTISWTTHEYICFPKGGIDAGEASEEAAIREVFEETGYRTNIVAPIKSWTYRFTENGESYEKTVDYYLMELADSEPPTPHREPGEDFENLWLSVDEARKRLSLDDGRAALDMALDLLHKDR